MRKFTRFSTICTLHFHDVLNKLSGTFPLREHIKTAIGIMYLWMQGGNWAWARGASADGSVVMGNIVFDDKTIHPFRWTQSGGMQDLGNLGGASTTVTGMSADGLAAVGDLRFADGTYHVFIASFGGKASRQNSVARPPRH